MKIRVSVFVYVLALAMTFFGFFGQFVSYFTAVLLHELAHARCASKLGYALNEFRLMPYGAALIGEFEDADWRDECLIAAAGPLLNVILLIFCIALWWIVPETYFFTENFAYACLSIAAVNLLPVYPLDGGRIVLALLSRKHNRAAAYKKLRICGYVAGVLFAALFVASCFFGANLSYASMSAFIILSTLIPDNRCRYQRLYQLSVRSKKAKKGVRIQRIMLRADAPSRMLFKWLNSNYYTEFFVVDANLRPLAEFSECDLERLPSEAYGGTVSDVIQACAFQKSGKNAQKNAEKTI